MERATGLEPASGIPRMAGHSREPCRTSHLTRLRRRWRQRVLSLVGKSFSCTENRSIKNGAGDGLEPASGIPRMAGHSREPAEPLISRAFGAGGGSGSSLSSENPSPARENRSIKMERATGLEPASGIPRMAGHSREPCRTSHLTRLRRRWRQRVLSLVGNPSPARENRSIKNGAGDGARTRYLHLGKVALYQMSYARKWCLRSESNQRHADFSPLLYQLSYRGIWGTCVPAWKMATQNGLEPSTSSVTGWRSNQLNYWAMSLFGRVLIKILKRSGGNNWTRTSDPLLVRQVL